jgi:dipeptidyl aminopeptidase/acylaminoacyl peptidase
VVDAEGFLVFTDSTTQGIYRASPDGQTISSIVSSPDTVYGDLASHPNNAELVLAVRQVSSPENSQVKISIVCINTKDHTETVLCQGSDFYSHPRFSFDGTMVCWLEWDHPHMPWIGAQLFAASWSSGLAGKRRVGEHLGVGQPRWSLDRKLFYCHDDTGYQQLYYVSFENDFSQTDPQWLRINGLEEVELAGAEFLLSSSTYFHLDESHMVITYTRAARSQLALVNLVSGTYADLGIGLNDIAYDALQRVNSREFLAIGSMSDCPSALYHIYLPEVLKGVEGKISCLFTKIAQSFDTSGLPDGMLSTPEPMTFPRSHGLQARNAGSSAFVNTGHAFLMRPTNANCTAGAEELPPCIIMAHGGPTKHHRPSINLESQYFTSRGYAVVLLNHVGSTGYGKAYRDAMDGLWGVADVQDAVDAVQALVRNKVIDPKRVGITGPSAGGYLTLQAICTHTDVWAGAVSVFGISDMTGFTATTHHFESHYDYLLVRGRDSLNSMAKRFTRHSPSSDLSDTKQEDTKMLRKLYESRSPVARARENKVPVLLLQGSEDSVVTPDQALGFVEAAKQSSNEDGVARDASVTLVELIMYEHEGHGFHLAITKKDNLERMENWWKRTLV